MKIRIINSNCENWKEQEGEEFIIEQRTRAFAYIFYEKLFKSLQNYIIVYVENLCRKHMNCPC